jgi:HSP20 family molecular chaperone IbpA
MTLLTHRPTTPLSELFDWLDTRTFLHPTDAYIPVDEFVEDGTYVVRADLPGIDPDKDVSVVIEDNLLTIQGERHEEKHDKHRSEVRYGSFTRHLRLPTGCRGDDVTASYADGVLKVSMPMIDAPGEPTKVPIAHSAD